MLWRMRKPHPIRKRRLALGLKGVELAREAGIAVSTLCDIEQGRNARPAVGTALAIAGALKVQTLAEFTALFVVSKRAA